jgi:hypothetical protein
MPGGYPDCSTCGHNVSAFAGACTAFIVESVVSVSMHYCGHDCTKDPVVAAWLAEGAAQAKTRAAEAGVDTE